MSLKRGNVEMPLVSSSYILQHACQEFCAQTPLKREFLTCNWVNKGQNRATSTKSVPF